MTDSEPALVQEPPRRRLRRTGLMLLSVFLLILIMAVGGVVYAIGRPISAPPWLQSRIETRIAKELPDTSVEFGDMVFVLGEGWRPRVRLSDVTVKTAAGQEIVKLREFNAALSLRELLRGKMQPRKITLTGLFAGLERSSHGRYSLRAVQGNSSVQRQAKTVPELIKQVDQLMTLPALSSLKEVQLRALTLRYEDAVSGRAWTADGGRLLLTREKGYLALTADLALLGEGSGVAILAANYSSRIGETKSEFGATFQNVPARDIASQSPVFAWLEVLRAPISGAVRSGFAEDGTLSPVHATLQIGAGVVQPTDQTEPVPFQSARSYFSYLPKQELLRFDEVSVRSKWVSVSADGTAQMQGVRQGKLTGLMAQLNLHDLVANPMDLYAKPVEITTADADFHLALNPFSLRLGRLQINDGGNTLLVDGKLSAQEAGWQFALNGRMDGIDPQRVLALWPERLKPKTRNWLVDNLHQGNLSDIDIAMRRNPDQKQPDFYVAFDYDNAEVQYLKTLPPVVGGKGHLSLADKRLVITVDDGHVNAPEGGRIRLAGSSFILPNVGIKGGAPSVIRLSTESPIVAALSLLDRPPLNVMTKAGLPVQLADGRVALDGTLAVPLRKGGSPDDAVFHFSGSLTDVRSDILIKDRTLTAPKLQLQTDNRQVAISGAGRLDGVPFDGRWAQAIGQGGKPGNWTGTLQVDQQALDTFNIALPPGMLSGRGRARVSVSLPKGQPPEYQVQSNLSGIGLAVPQLSWVKPPGQSGRLELGGKLGPVPSVDSMIIDAPGLTASGRLSLKPGGGLDVLRLGRLNVGRWLNASVDLVGQGQGRSPQVVLRGGRLDMRNMPSGGSGTSGGGNAAGAPMLVKLDRLQITDTLWLGNMQGRFGTGRGLDGGFSALLNGAAAVQGRVTPKGRRSAVRLTAKDAGAVLRASGLLKTVYGGQLTLDLLPVGSGGAFDGRVIMSDIRVKEAPAIAALLNAASGVGLLNQLNGDGIFFDTVEGDFRLTPQQLTLLKSSAVGASMGLSMDGRYALKSGLLDMQGVISPIYMFNGIGSILTRKGEGLIGFNYRLRGLAKDPKVSVNPLSALTPAMFRNIFRAPPPKVPEVEGITQSTLPQRQPARSDKAVVEPYEGR